MTWFAIHLWPGAGYGLDTFTAEGDSLLDAMDSISGALLGTVYVVSPDDFEDYVRELMADGSDRKEAEDYALEQYAPLDDGSYLFTVNMRSEKIPGPYGVRCSRCGFTLRDDLMANGRCPVCNGTMRRRGTGKGTRPGSESVRRSNAVGRTASGRSGSKNAGTKKPKSASKPRSKAKSTKGARR